MATGFVMKIDFRISPTAADFIRDNKLQSADGREMVIQLYASLQVWPEPTAEIATLEQAIDYAQKNMQSLPSRGLFRWVVGSNFRDSVPSSDIHWVEGIPFDLPEDINRTIGSRELVLDDGKLRFEPDFEPFSYKLPGKRDP
jgi:hypothetical protein